MRTNIEKRIDSLLDRYTDYPNAEIIEQIYRNDGSSIIANDLNFLISYIKREIEVNGFIRALKRQRGIR